jgi:membrane protein DedA with SNARE-associated domain
VSGIVFDYWLALLIVMAGSAVGMSLQYWLARWAVCRQDMLYNCIV